MEPPFHKGNTVKKWSYVAMVIVGNITQNNTFTVVETNMEIEV